MDAENLYNLLGKFDKYNARKRAEQAIEQAKNGQKPASTPEQPGQPNPQAPADPMQQVQDGSSWKDFDGNTSTRKQGIMFGWNHAKLGPVRLSMADIDQAGNEPAKPGGKVFAWDPNSRKSGYQLSLTEGNHQESQLSFPVINI